MTKKKSQQPQTSTFEQYVQPPFRGTAPEANERRIIVPIDSVTPDDQNARSHPEKNIRQVRASLRRRGQVTPIVVDRDGKILKGNGTQEAARGEGWSYIWIEVTGMEGAEAVGYAIADNASALSAKWDFEQLATNIRIVDAAFEGTDLAFTPDDFAMEDFEISPLLAAEWQPGEFTGEGNAPTSAPAGTHTPAPVTEPGSVQPGGTTIPREVVPTDPHADIDADDVARPELAIAMTRNMRTTVDAAIERVRLISGDLTISDGKCIELICGDYLAGAPNRSDAISQYENATGRKITGDDVEEEVTDDGE